MSPRREEKSGRPEAPQPRGTSRISRDVPPRPKARVSGFSHDEYARSRSDAVPARRDNDNSLVEKMLSKKCRAERNEQVTGAAGGTATRVLGCDAKTSQTEGARDGRFRLFLRATRLRDAARRDRRPRGTAVCGHRLASRDDPDPDADGCAERKRRSVAYSRVPGACGGRAALGTQIFTTAVPSKIYRVCLFFRLVTRVSCDIFSARGAERLRSQRKRRRYLAGVRLGRNTSTRASTPASRRLGKDPPRVAFVYPRDALSVVSPRDSTRTPARGKSRAR